MTDNALPRRFVITTLGCKVNQVESEAVAAGLEEAGWTPDASDGAVDACIINTCTVTAKAAMQSRQAVRRCIRAHPGARIIVTGCHAQTASAELAAIDGVDAVVDNTGKHRLEEIIPSTVSAARPPVEGPRLFTGNVSGVQGFFPSSPGLPPGRRRPFIKIQDGCNARCTYCIVPHARGRSRSMPQDRVIAHARRIHGAGFHEAVLTGIHLGTYGEDLTPRTSLARLVDDMIRATALPRIRLSSIEPGELSAEIIALAAESGRLCRHFHVPLQSGDNEILQRMNRPYTREDYCDAVLDVRRRIPDCGLGADVLVGFPGESDAAFQNTWDLISRLPVTHLHVFPFSPRRGTPAFSMPHPVAPETIKKRSRFLRLLGRRKKAAFYSGMVGKTVSVVPEQRRMDGRCKGTSTHYIPVIINGPVDPAQGVCRVTITGVVRGDGPEGDVFCVGDLVS